MGLPGTTDIQTEDKRKQLADLAYTLPLEEVERLLMSIQHRPGTMLELTENL
jgi:hypothetical protein